MKAAGIPPNFVRFSVGLEHPDDLKRPGERVGGGRAMSAPVVGHRRGWGAGHGGGAACAMRRARCELGRRSARRGRHHRRRGGRGLCRARASPNTAASMRWRTWPAASRWARRRMRSAASPRERMMDLNAWSFVALAAPVVAQMKRQGSGHITSAAAAGPAGVWGAYIASKSALQRLYRDAGGGTRRQRHRRQQRRADHAGHARQPRRHARRRPVGLGEPGRRPMRSPSPRAPARQA